MNKNIFEITKTEKCDKPQIFLKFDKKEINKIFMSNEYNTLINYKNKIEELENASIWDKSKKYSNKYELIYLPNKKK